MIIEKIEIENFHCYCGPVEFEFKEGINVIIGDNGYGKSKLYDAFYWVMYDHVFSSELERLAQTKEVRGAIVSDKAKYELSNGDSVSAVVKITFNDQRKNEQYILERKFTVSKIDDKIVPNNDGELTVLKKEAYLNAKIVTDEEDISRIRNKILPDNVKEYLWFQGEQMNSIIDFNDPETLKKAINVLSNISRYDLIQNIAAAAAKAATNEYDREVKRLSKDSAKSTELIKRKQDLESKIEQDIQTEKEVRENLTIADEKCASLLNRLNDAQKVRDLYAEKQKLISNHTLLQSSLREENISFQRKMFRNKWVLKGTEILHEQYSNIFNEYQQNKLKQKAEEKAKEELESEINKKLQHRLPLDVPEPIYVMNMLEQERCLVCNREAKENSDAWKSIKELLERPKAKDKKQSQAKHDFSPDLKLLYQNGLGLANRIGQIDEDINEVLTKKLQLGKNIKEIKVEIDKLEIEIARVLAETSISSDSANSIIAEFSIQNKYSKDFTDKLNRVTQQIDHNKNILKDIDDQLKQLVTGTIPVVTEEKKRILIDFEALAISTRERIFSKLIERLESEANVHYQAMTFGNKSARGLIQLSKRPNGNYMPEIVDDNGNPLLGSNTSNLILVKLSAIMAIITAKTSSDMSNLYTLITDAPTSAFGDDYTIGFCKTISKVYKQSIIMSKEFYRNVELKNQLLSSPDIKIGWVYMLTPSIKEIERSNRNSLYTTVNRLN